MVDDAAARVASLNADFAAGNLDLPAFQHAMREHGDAWQSLVAERCPYLFADVAVFVSSAQLQQMRDVIDAVERVVRLPGWCVERDVPFGLNKISNKPVIPAQAGIQSKNNAFVEILDSGLRRNDENNNVQHSAKGVFYGFDFHLDEQGAHLIEINTNAGGGFLNALLLDSQRNTELPGANPVHADASPFDTSGASAQGAPSASKHESSSFYTSGRTDISLELAFLEMFRNEWRLERGDAPLKTIAIVDDQPEEQYLYPEFLLARNIFESAGITTHIVDPEMLHLGHDGLYLVSEKIDLVYNRLTDFDLQRHPQLRSAYEKKQVVITPSPANYRRYADKRKLALLTDAGWLRAAGVSQGDIDVLLKGIPQTRIVRAEDADTWWAERKQWFFKPVSGYGGKGAYRGEKLTRRVFEEIMHGDYVAQRLAVPGERTVSVKDSGPVPLKYDVRCYVYDGQVQLVAARLYQGQTTNFRTPGGGFAPVRVVE